MHSITKSQDQSTAITVFQELEKYSVANTLPIPRLQRILENLLFFRLPDEPKSKWRTEDGLLAWTLRRRVILCCLKMARKNLFDDFVSRRSPTESNPTIPLWLTKIIDKTFVVKRDDGKTEEVVMKKNYLLKFHIKKTVDSE